VGRHALAKDRRRRSVAGSAVIVAAATLFVAGADTHPTNNRDVACCAEVMAPGPASGNAQHAPGSAPNEMPAASRGAARREIQQVLPTGVAPEKGLQVKTILAARSVSATFPEILDIGGVRADPLKWHPHGLAIDVMIPNYNTAEGKALGDRVVAYALANAERFGLNHLIWRQTLYPRSGAPRRMKSRGSDTANHYDHVHIATSGGGFPTGGETYLR
jgi:hypothetical protein